MTADATPRASVGVIGGSGFYSLLENAHPLKVDTPYGPPSDQISLGTLAGRTVAFLPRHGRHHTLPPHAINYRANLFALKSLGVTDILAPSACGSLQPHIQPGDLVIVDQFVDRTRGRADTFFDGPVATHVAAAEPYCPLLRGHAVAVCRQLGLPVHESGTVVVIQGPRFSTRAESRWFTQMGWDVVGMTQYPEAYLALELEMAYAGASLITDYDAALVTEAGVAAVTSEEVMRRFRESQEQVRAFVLRFIETLPDTAKSPSRHSLAAARLE